MNTNPTNTMNTNQTNTMNTNNIRTWDIPRRQNSFLNRRRANRGVWNLRPTRETRRTNFFYATRNFSNE